METRAGEGEIQYFRLENVATDVDPCSGRRYFEIVMANPAHLNDVQRRVAAFLFGSMRRREPDIFHTTENQRVHDLSDYDRLMQKMQRRGAWTSVHFIDPEYVKSWTKPT